MSEIESQGSLSEDKDSQEEGNVRMVPVGESVRYHRRAQSAEKRVDELAEELEDARAEARRLAEELAATQKEQELMRRLAAEGTRDLEAAVLIAKSRLGGKTEADTTKVVEQLKKEKGYLFSQASAGCGGASGAPRTSPVKEQRGGGGTIERAAKKAAGTGSRADLQEYMRKRRVLSF